MGCRSFGVNTVLVGLHSIGMVKLKNALEKAANSGLTGRDEIVDLLIETLDKDNYIPDPGNEDFRISMWREYLRFMGEDFSSFYSEIEVTVLGEPGNDREMFVDRMESVFADFELRPCVTFAPPGEEGRNPQLVINGDVIVRGILSRANFKSAVRRSITDW